MAVKIKLDHAAMAQILKVNMRKPVDEVADRIAAAVDLSVSSVSDAPVTVRSYTTDRAAASIAIAHPAGIGMEARHGILRKAAASQGFEVHAPKGKSK